ncbi:RAD50-interacting protein 1-like isoform X2 [Clavelina lepadiformis]|uniref:RAD50-interacting protein 1-like isoform X2 n=1 Tax=Clavelina lepadiformis TaxID=159417 RepID=UPI00404262D9
MTTKHSDVHQYIESTFGSDIKSLKNIKKIYEETLKKKQTLEQQLSVVTTEVPTKIEEALSSAKSSLEKVIEVQKSKDSLTIQASECLEKCAPPVERFQQSVSRVNEIEKYISYMKWITKIEETSGEIQQSILSDSMKDACIIFKELVNYHTELVNHGTNCCNLTGFLKKMILFWYDILKDKLSKELDAILKLINWPFISAPGPHTISKSANGQDKQMPSPFTAPDPACTLESIIGNLLNIQLPKILLQENSDEATGGSCSDNRAPSSNGAKDEYDQLLLPFQHLLRPLKKRFRYHFSGSKQTNDIRKPEWYLAQILNWIGHHSGFLEHTIQPILDKHEHGHIDALVIFTQGLLQLVVSKLANDMEEIIYYDDVFSHVVDEVLMFDRELRSAYNIPDMVLKIYGPLIVFSQPTCMKKWLTIERLFAVERLDALLSSDDAWKSKFELSDIDDVDEMKTPECAESFVSMLLAITDRYKNLPSMQEQIQFLDLQLLLLDDFRIRLTQVFRSFANNHCDDTITSILNAAYYVTVVLQEWADNIFFLELKYQKDKNNNLSTTSSVVPNSLLNLGESSKATASTSEHSTDDTVFEPMVVLYERIYNEGVERIGQLILAEFKARSRPYLNDQWLALPPAEEQVTLIVSRSACGMLEVLQDRLYLFQQRLCTMLFTQLWRWVAEAVDIYLFSEMVLENHFNEGGALQLQFDITRNLFPLFGPYTGKPENYFKRLKETCHLLNLHLGNALLLEEVFEEMRNQSDDYDVKTRSDPVAVLAEMGIHLLTPSNARNILNRRVDWTSN